MVLSVFHWRENEPLGNFGDALTLLYQERMFDGTCLFRSGAIHLVGSVISTDRVTRSCRHGYQSNDGLGRAIFWGCGKKNVDPLPPELARRSIFLGVRGTMTRDALGLSATTPLGDTALLLPQFYTPKPDARTSGKVLWVPHVHHPDPTSKDIPDNFDPVIMRPDIPNTPADCEAFIDAIASADFVMANAMHAAVVALAYGTPFAFWGGSYINHPFKWADFASGVGFEMPFASSSTEGRALYDSIRPDRHYASWDPTPLMDVAPFRFRQRIA